MDVRIAPGGLDNPRVRRLLQHHLRTARAATAEGSAHALAIEALRAPGIDFWSAWTDDTLLGVGALKRLTPGHGEIKSMHTAESARRRGVGRMMLRHIIAAARESGMARLSLRDRGVAVLRTRARLLQERGIRGLRTLRRLLPGRSQQRLHEPRPDTVLIAAPSPVQR